MSLAVLGMSDDVLPVVKTALAVSLWWCANPSAVLKVVWMGVAFRSTKTNADGKRANKFRVDRDCPENIEYLERILLMVGMAAYEREQDPFFSRPVSEQVRGTLDRRSAVMVDNWSKERRGDHEHEGRTRHVFRDTFANLLAKEVASKNGLDDQHVSTKSLKVLAITTLEEARTALGMSQQQVATFCDHKSLAGNAAYKQLPDKQSTLSLAAKAVKRPMSWGVSAVPEPVLSQSKKRSREGAEAAASSSTTVVGQETRSRDGKRAIKTPAKLRD